MDFGWTITDQSNLSSTEDPDDFAGYFTDISRAARRSLPKNPTKDLCHLLGIHLVPAKLGSRASVYAVRNVEDRLVPGQSIIQTAHRPPDIPTYNKTLLDRTISALPCSGYLENRPHRERTVMGVAIYLAIIIIILLIIIIILAATLSSAAAGDGFGDRIFIETSDESIKITSPTSSSTTVKIAPSMYTSGTSIRSHTSPSDVSVKLTITTPISSTFTSTESVTRNKFVTSSSFLPTTGARSSSSTPAESTPSISSSSIDTSTFIPNVTTPSGVSPPTAGSTVNPNQLPRLSVQNVSKNCSSHVCHEARVAISRADFSTSPCEDFYQFACGKWIQTKQELRINSTTKNIPRTTQEESRQKLLLQIIEILSESYSEEDSFAERVSKRLYQSCLESNQLQNETLVLQQLHSLVDPLGMSSDGSIVNTIPNILADVKRRFDHTPFFQTDMYPIATATGQSVFGLKVSPPKMFLEKIVYSMPLESSQMGSSYVTAGAEILHLYTSSFDNRGLMSFKQAYDTMLTMFSIEGRIARILNEVESEGQHTELAHQTNISSLLETYPSTPWDNALNVDNKTINILIVNPEYFRLLDDLLRQLNNDDVMMYIFMSTLIHRVWSYMPISFRNIFQNVTLSSDSSYTSIDCVEYALDLAKEEIHSLYINTFTPSVLYDRLALTDLVDDIMISFRKIIRYPIWLEQDLRRVVIAFQRSMKIHFSLVNSQLVSSGKIEALNQDFLILVHELQMQLYAIKMDKLGANVTVDDMLVWDSMNVIYDSYTNTLGIPTALGIYIGEGNETSFATLGQVGQLLSVQIIKMLTGSLPQGVAPSWWSALNILRFENVTSCFTGQQTLLQRLRHDIGSIIIANGGFQLTRETYNSSDLLSASVIPGTTMTHYQLFYLHSVQMHCDSAYTISVDKQLLKDRVNNVMINLGNFDHHFSCPANSPMVTKDPCLVLQDERYAIVVK